MTYLMGSPVVSCGHRSAYCMNKKNNKKNATRKQASRILNLENRILQLQRQPKPSVRKSPKMVSTISPPAQKYMLACVHPHSEHARGAYIPNSEARASQKYTARSKVVLSIPTDSTAIVYINPSYTSDSPSLFVITGTTASFNNTNAYYTYTGAAPTGLTYTTYTMPMPYTAASLSGGYMNARGISFGARVRYTGSALNRGGTAVFVREVGNSQGVMNSTDATTAKLVNFFNYWRGKPQARIVSFMKNDTHEFIVHNPTGGWGGSGDEKYWATDGAYNTPFGVNTGTSYPNPESVLLLQNTTGSAALEFTIDLVLHAEYSGGQSVQLYTPSPPSVNDHAIVNNAIQHAQETHAQVPDKHPAEHTVDVLDTLTRSAKDFGNTLLNTAIREVVTPANAERLAVGLAGMFL